MTAVDQVVGLIPVVVATDVATRVVDRSFPREKQKKRKRNDMSLNHNLRL